VSILVSIALLRGCFFGVIDGFSPLFRRGVFEGLLFVLTTELLPFDPEGFVLLFGGSGEPFTLKGAEPRDEGKGD